MKTRGSDEFSEDLFVGMKLQLIREQHRKAVRNLTYLSKCNTSSIYYVISFSLKRGMLFILYDENYVR